MWAAGVVILEMYAGGLTALTVGRGDNALDLLETCARHTADVTAPVAESRSVMTPKRRPNTHQHEGGAGDGASATGRGLGRPRVAGGVGSGSPRGNGGTKKRYTFRVDMPDGVLAVLRDIFQREPGDRPESMEVGRYTHRGHRFVEGYVWPEQPRVTNKVLRCSESNYCTQESDKNDKEALCCRF